MKPTPSPRVRFFAILALILVAGGGAYMLIHGSSSTSNTAGTQTTLRATKHTQTTAKRGAKLEKSKKSASVGGINALDAALVNHPLVVVSVYARNVSTDDQAMSEA